jgi:hypothetical protein
MTIDIRMAVTSPDYALTLEFIQINCFFVDRLKSIVIRELLFMACIPHSVNGRLSQQRPCSDYIYHSVLFCPRFLRIQIKSCVKEAFRLSFQHAKDSSVEGLELISPAWRDSIEGDSKLCSRLFHGFSAMCGIAVE